MRTLALILLGLGVVAYKSLPVSAVQAPVEAPAEHASDLILQSADGGTTWQDLSQGLPEKLVVTQIFAQDGAVFLAADGGGVYRSIDLGKGTWEREEIGLYLPNSGGVFENRKSVMGMFAGQAGPYASVYEDGYYQRINETGVWKPMLKTYTGKPAQTLFENEEGALFVGSEGGIYKSADKGQTWEQVYNEGRVYNLSGVGKVIVGSSSHGLLRSTDGGAHWECVLKDEGSVYNINPIGSSLAAVRFAGDWRRAEGEDPRRTFISSDGGTSWQRIDDMMSRVWKVTDVEQAGNYLFCCHEAGVSRSADGGKSWELVRSSAVLKDPLRYELVVAGDKVFIVKVWAGC